MKYTVLFVEYRISENPFLIHKNFYVQYLTIYIYIYIYEGDLKSDAFFFSIGIITDSGTCGIH